MMRTKMTKMIGKGVIKMDQQFIFINKDDVLEKIKEDVEQFDRKLLKIHMINDDIQIVLAESVCNGKIEKAYRIYLKGKSSFMITENFNEALVIALGEVYDDYRAFPYIMAILESGKEK